MTETAVDIISALKADYERFPFDQTYGLYDSNVFFKDPWISFRGIKPYRLMIRFIEGSFIDVKMDLHDIQQVGNQITSRWTLSWIAAVPWKPTISISGRSELTLNPQGLIQSHVDYWDCSRLAVLKQLCTCGRCTQCE